MKGEGRMNTSSTIGMRGTLWSAVLIAMLAAVDPVQARVRSNTQEALPGNVYIADIDGDGSADFIEVNGGKIVARRTGFYLSTILTDVLWEGNILTDDPWDNDRIVKVITGDFVAPGARERGKDQVCIVLRSGIMSCYAISDDKKSMWWWFWQWSIVGPDEDALVGDFNGDGR